MPRTRMNDRRDRQAQILRAACALAKTIGYENLTRENVSNAAEVSPALVTLHFSTMPQFRRAVMRFAVTHAIVEIVAHGVAVRHPIAMKAPPALKEQALKYIARG